MNYSGNFKKAVIGGFDKEDVFKFFTKYDEDHKKETEELNRQISELKKEADQKREKEEQLESQISLLREEKDSLELSLAGKEEELEQLKKDVQSLRAFNSEVSMKKSVLENHNNRLAEEKSAMEKKLSDCAAALQEAADYRARTQQDLSALQAEKEELQAQNVILLSEKSLLEAEKNDLLAVKAQLEEQLEKESNPSQRLGEEISNIVVEAKNLADRIVVKAKGKAAEAEKSIRLEQSDLRELIGKTGDKLKAAAVSYRQIADDIARQMEQLCGRVDSAKEDLDGKDYFANEEPVSSEEPDAPLDADYELQAKVEEDYSEKLMEALRGEE